MRQAEGLVALATSLVPAGPCISSPYLRCVQTLGPISRAAGVSTEESEDLAEGQSAAAVRLVRALAGSDAIVCTHGDVIAEVLVSLADEDRVELGPNPRQAKGSVWALQGARGAFTSARYFPPVAVETV